MLNHAPILKLGMEDLAFLESIQDRFKTCLQERFENISNQNELIIYWFILGWMNESSGLKLNTNRKQLSNKWTASRKQTINLIIFYKINRFRLQIVVHNFIFGSNIQTNMKYFWLILWAADA